MTREENYHMTPDQFHRHGHRVVDWIADYYEKTKSRIH